MSSVDWIIYSSQNRFSFRLVLVFFNSLFIGGHIPRGTLLSLRSSRRQQLPRRDPIPLQTRLGYPGRV